MKKQYFNFQQVFQFFDCGHGWVLASFIVASQCRIHKELASL
jgi:hypothetical protein